MKSSCVALAAMAGFAAVQAESVQTNGGFAVDFVGKAPKFKVSTSSSPGAFVKVSLGKIQEVGGDGKVVQSSGALASEKGLTFAGPTQRDLGNGAVATEVTFSGFLLKDLSTVNVNVRTLLFATNATFADPDTGANVTVAENTFKWSIKFSSWPFLSTGNSLQFGIDLQSSNDGPDTDDTGSGSGSSASSASASASSKHRRSRAAKPLATSQKTTLAGFNLDFPESGFAGSVEKPVTVAIGAKTVLFTFPSFGAEGFVYDPTVAAASASASGAASIAARSVLALAAAALALAAL
jgi:hypothetical protein